MVDDQLEYMYLINRSLMEGVTTASDYIAELRTNYDLTRRVNIEDDEDDDDDDDDDDEDEDDEEYAAYYNK